MCFILNIETATRNCSVSIAKDGVTIALREIATEGFSHAEKLHVFVEELLTELSLSFADLSAVAVSKGPGSYTGLRIGVSSAKGFCFAANLPLISVDTLKILAAKANVNDGLIVPMIDARRMEVYTAIYSRNRDQIRDVEALIIDDNSLSGFDETLYIVGDCQEKVSQVLESENIKFLSDIIFPSADEMSALSFNKFQKKLFEDVAYFEPFYLKNFIGTTSKK